jgi:hypothetical protein
VFTNFTTSYPAIRLENAGLLQGVNLTNSSFTNIKATSQNSAIHFESSTNNNYISDSVFMNISHNVGSLVEAGAVYYNMGTDGNGYYNIKGYTFYDISTNKSVLVLSGIFSSLLFRYNTFYNVSSTGDRGVIFYLFIFFFFHFFYFYFIFNIYVLS